MNMESEKSVSFPPLETAQVAVDALYKFRDLYFDEFSIDRAKFKTDDVAEKLQETLRVLDSVQESVGTKADYLTLRGKALNVLPGYSSDAQDLLAKAVKLDPKQVEAWIQLGEVYWKNKDIEAAKNCFLGALNHCEDKVALRNLSMVLRQLGGSQEERIKLVQESLERAKSAVQLDLMDGTSWFILGNAYLSLFFIGDQSPKILKQCMSAYQQAEKDSVCKNNPDLHFNRATMDKYQEHYEDSLKGFSRAAALDPTWDEPPVRELQIVNYLDKVAEFIGNKGKFRGKKLTSMVESIKETDLGVYSGGSYTSTKGQSIKLEQKKISDLSEGINPEIVVVGKVVCSIATDEPVPFTFCMVDSTNTCHSVTVYNIVPGYGVKIGDSVAIAEPFVQVINFNYKGKEYDLRNIRVDSPVVLVVNGRKQGLDKQAPSMLSVSAMSE